ncbi:MAG: hypothetical protein U1C74_09185 [Phenylobacterium sp.]|nr:hypothetical protein [Phenylobacterium sp.]
MAEPFDFDLDELMKWYDEHLAAKRLRSENPQVRDLIEVLLPHPKGLGRSWAIDEIEKRRRAKGLSIPLKFEASVQSAYNQHSVDSVVWRKRGSPVVDGLFHSPDGKGSGKWAVYPDRAAKWLRSKLDSLD